MAWAGMNEAGLVISTMFLRETHQPASDERPPLISPMWVQYQLDTCSSIDEVMANDARVRVTEAVDHFLVCDSSGTCAAVELLEGETVLHTRDEMPVNALTNSLYQEAIRAWQTARLPNSALERFGAAADRATRFRPSDGQTAVAYAFETLNQVRIPDDEVTPTHWSIVFDAENLRLHFATSRNPRVRTVEFAKLDFACGAPRQMLDVHAPLSGDVSSALSPHSFRTILRQTLGFLESRGQGMSSLEVEVLERGVTSFQCDRSGVAHQAESGLLIPPVVGWAVLAALHRAWPVAAILGLGAVVLLIYRTRGRVKNA